MTYDNPVWIFVSKMLKFSDVIFSSFNGLERRFSDFLNTLWSVLSDRSKGKKLSFKCSTDLQNFRICFIKFRASLPLPFGFRCNPFRPRCCELMLSFSMHSEKYYVTFWRRRGWSKKEVLSVYFATNRTTKTCFFVDCPLWFATCIFVYILSQPLLITMMVIALRIERRI